MSNKELEGALFKNDKKTSENQPDYKGSAMIQGIDYWLSAWINKSVGGVQYLKIKATAKDGQQAPQTPSKPAPQPPAQPQAATCSGDDMSLPF